MSASVVTTRLAKVIEPTLLQSGFVRKGRTFVRAERTLHGFIELRLQPKANPGIARFGVIWGMALPGLVARYNRPDISSIHIVPGRELVPPRKHYAGSSPGSDRSIPCGASLKDQKTMQGNVPELY